MNRFIGFVTLLILASCATAPYQPYAREVKKKPGLAGVISLKPTYIEADRTYADTLMNKNCGTNTVNVLEEGEVAVGTTTVSNSQARKDKEEDGFSLGGFKMLTGGTTDVKNTATSSQTVAVKEWHINYECKTQVAKNSKTAAKKTR